MTDEKITLTLNERLILANQYLILEALYPQNAETFQKLRTIVEDGYELQYNDLNVDISESRLSEAECREVIDILDMHRALYDSYNRLENKEDVDPKEIQFEGFDGNDGSGRLGYASFLVLTQGRWQEILEGRPHFDLNSHMPVIEMYRRMLNVWNALNRSFKLTAGEIQQIVNAKTHPDSR